MRDTILPQQSNQFFEEEEVKEDKEEMIWFGGVFFMSSAYPFVRSSFIRSFMYDSCAKG